MPHKIKISLIVSGILLVLPSVVFAAARDLTGLMRLVFDLIHQASIVVLALALLVFLWGLARFIMYANNEDKKKEGKTIMVWGIVALFVMVSISGIIRILDNTFFDGGGGGSLTPTQQFQTPKDGSISI